MQSTRAWLADALERERDRLARSVSHWIVADGTLGLSPDEVEALTGTVLGDLRSWLRCGHESSRLQARTRLQSDRVAALAGSSASEFLKLEGMLDDLPRAARREVIDALDTFFTGRPEQQENGGSEARRDREAEATKPPARTPEAGA